MKPEYDKFHVGKKERLGFDEHGVIHVTEKIEERNKAYIAILEAKNGIIASSFSK